MTERHYHRDSSLPGPRVASVEPVANVPHLNDVGNHTNSHAATRNRAINLTPNRYPITRKSSDVAGYVRTRPEQSEQGSPPINLHNGFQIPPYRMEAASYGPPPPLPPFRGGAPPTSSNAHRQPVVEKASATPFGTLAPSRVFPREASRRLATSPITVDQQQPQSTAIVSLLTQTHIAHRDTSLPGEHYTPTSPPPKDPREDEAEQEDEPALSYDLREECVRSSSGAHREAELVSHGTQSSPSRPHQSTFPTVTKGTSSTSSYQVDGNLRTSTDDFEDDHMYVPSTVEDLREELSRLRALIDLEGRGGMHGEAADARRIYEDRGVQGEPTEDAHMAELRQAIQNAEHEEVALAKTLDQKRDEVRQVRQQRHAMEEQHRELVAALSEDVSHIQDHFGPSAVAYETGNRDKDMFAQRALGTIIHRKNIAFVDLDRASHGLIEASRAVPVLSAAVRSARLRYSEEVSAAKNRAAAERAQLETREKELDEKRRVEVEGLQERAREYLRVSANSAPSSSPPEFGEDAAGGTALQRTPSATSRQSAAPKQPVVASKSSTVPTGNRRASATSARTPSSLVARSASSASTATDKRKPFVVPNKVPLRQPHPRADSPSIPPRSNTPHKTRDAHIKPTGGAVETNFTGESFQGSVRSGRRPVSPQPQLMSPPAHEDSYSRPTRLLSTIHAVPQFQPPAAVKRLLTPPSLSRGPLTNHRHLHVEDPPHPSNMHPSFRPPTY